MDTYAAKIQPGVKKCKYVCPRSNPSSYQF